MSFFDLSLPFDAQTLSGTSGRKITLRLQATQTVKDNGVGGLEITFGNHIGTHVDAPAHLVPGGKTIDQIAPERFYGTAVVLDLPRSDNGAVTASELQAAEPAVQEGDIVVISTGWGGRYGEAVYSSHHPYLTTDAADWLVQRGVRMLAMDVQSVDLPHSLRPSDFRYTSLRRLLENGIPVLHSVTGLAPLLGRRVLFYGMPVVFAGADGAPVRAFAVDPSHESPVPPPGPTAAESSTSLDRAE